MAAAGPLGKDMEKDSDCHLSPSPRLPATQQDQSPHLEPSCHSSHCYGRDTCKTESVRALQAPHAQLSLWHPYGQWTLGAEMLRGPARARGLPLDIMATAGHITSGLPYVPH